MSQQIQDTVRNFIVERFMFGQGAEKLAKAHSFLEMGIIDSTGVLELVSFLEEQFEIKVDDKELIPENLDSLGQIETFVLRKQKA